MSTHREDRKRVDQKTRRFLPPSDAVIENHLLGKASMTPWLSWKPARS